MRRAWASWRTKRRARHLPDRLVGAEGRSGLSASGVFGGGGKRWGGMDRGGWEAFWVVLDGSRDVEVSKACGF